MIVTGTSGDDDLFGTSGADSISGLEGDDWLTGGQGNDTLDGGSHAKTGDYADYSGDPAGVQVSLATGQAIDGWGNGDTLTGIENLHGSAFNDTLQGDAGNNQFRPAAGNDSIDGGLGTDLLIYSAATGAITVDLLTGIATGAGIGQDNFQSIEAVQGGTFADRLILSNVAGGYALGRTGNDTLIGGTADESFTGGSGNDVIDGGAGFDLLKYGDDVLPGDHGVVVDLAAGTATDDWSFIDSLTGIEAVLGSSFADTLVGSSAAFESFEGAAGNDTIDGEGGTDRVSYESSTSGVSVSLTTASASDGWGGTDALSFIENIRGSDFNDTLTGDAGSNDIEGRAGDDSLVGGNGGDFLRGGAGNDTLDGGDNENPFSTASENAEFDGAYYGDATSGVTVLLGASGIGGTATGGGGSDTLTDIELVVGSAFNDLIRGSNRSEREIIRGGAGNDTLSGGDVSGTDAGFNLVDYRFAASSVVVDLAAGTATGGDGNDVLSGFDGLFGSAYADRLTGNSRDNYLEGQGGNDFIDGGAGNDYVSYSNASGAVTVNVAAGTASGADGSDSFVAIENVRGSSHADTIVGDEVSNDLQGREGNDTISAGEGEDTVYGGLGNDSLDGGSHDSLLGWDWVSYSTVDAAVTVNLATGLATGGDGTDQLVNFEAVAGTAFADTLTGDANTNVLRGNGGNDTLDGGAGDDWADYHGSASSVTVSLVTNTATGGDGNDVLVGIERIRGSSFDDLLTGNSADNRLRGNAGNDTLDGGAGNDGADYYLAGSAVTVRLASGTATGGDGNDTLLNIENIHGSYKHGDDLQGNASANFIDGRGGNDLLTGGDGNDTLQGSDGNDTLDGGAGTDTAVFTFDLDQYRVVAQGTNLLVSGPEGDDLLIGIELLQFADRLLQVQIGTDAAEQITGGAQSEAIYARGGDDVVNAGEGDDAVYGGDGNDQLRGQDGQDFLDGGDGVDTLKGGLGNDTYAIDSADDTIVEFEEEAPASTAPQGSAAAEEKPLEDGIGGGIDKVVASINHTLGNFVENLTMAAGTAALAGVGNALENVLTGNAGSNQLNGQGGNDQIDGGEGIDTAVYAGARSQYVLTAGASYAVNGSATGEGTDTLTNVERLQFSDTWLAIDLAGNGGMVAKILGAVFGQAAVSDRALAGIGLNITDTSGQTYEQLMQLALNFRLGGSPSNAAVVDLLYTNVIGAPPDAATQAFFVSWITDGSFTQASLAVMAADFMGIPSAAANGLEFI